MNMDELQFIVGRLSEKPFNVVIRAVDFDENTPDEHLQVLNDVLASLDASIKADIRISPREEVVEQMLQFLLMHKCSRIPGVEDVLAGQKASIYPILHWVLSEYENLEKRAYLSQYLMPIDVPSEFLAPGNGNLEELLDMYKELQAEFIEVHKHYESTKASMDRPTSDLIDGIKQMEAEEEQLLDLLQREQAQTNNNTSFQHLLTEASKMRQAQDDEIRLDEQKQQQLQNFATTKRRLSQAQHMMDVMISCESKPIESVLNELEHEYQRSVDHLESDTMQQRHKEELVLLQAEKEADFDNAEDLEYVIEMAAQLEESLNHKRRELNNHHENSSKLEELKQNANEEATKLQAVQEDIDYKTMEKELLKATNKELRESVFALDSDGIKGPDGTSITWNEFAKLKNKLRTQSEIYDESKQDIATIQHEISELQAELELTKEQQHSLREHFQQEEERAGVSGFRDINDKLEQTGKETDLLNNKKEQTLDEISSIVEEISCTLEGKKQELEPLIEELKQERKQFQEIQERHRSDKASYDKAAAKLMGDNKHLENECSRLQKEWVEKDRRYHLLCAKDELAASDLSQIEKVGSWRNLYEAKSAEQQDLVKELCAKHEQAGIKLSKEYTLKQKSMFDNLKKLLELKAQVLS